MFTWPIKWILKKIAPLLILIGVLELSGYGDDIEAWIESIFGGEEEPKDPVVTETTTLGA